MPVVHADMSGGQAIDLPGVRGRMERLEFASGIVLYRMEYEALDDCFVQVQNSFSEPWIGSALHLQGHSELAYPDGKTFTLTPDSALLMRVDPSGSRFHLFKGQLVRHVGVASTLAPLQARFDGQLPGRLALFTDNSFGDFQLGQSFSPSPRLRHLASNLFDNHAKGSTRLLKLEGIANLFLAEIIELFCEENPTKDRIVVWEDQSLSDIIAHIEHNLDGTLALSALANMAGLSENRLDQLFRQKFQLSCAEYVRNERMSTANRWLQSGELPVREVAKRVGYSHVSNFSRAYRARFGETPARTLRRATSRST
ncbi:AraC family transcriptional regulator [Halopseudomonas maritima]|uniref:AraC family transcriptional regulator n=1 Tax=Halopseudomonas maritima TaxID=2918528 RepID=UPI001EEB3B6E|nr:AraC family transcriptional regulator [Halopseudomonas maritima]UJJ30658.1 AraC family transcriptional regulator [Halopseudomonas maritima]